jgi:hypothetical protein
LGRGGGFVFAHLVLRDHRPSVFQNKVLKRRFLFAWKKVKEVEGTCLLKSFIISVLLIAESRSMRQARQVALLEVHTKTGT